MHSLPHWLWPRPPPRFPPASTPSTRPRRVGCENPTSVHVEVLRPDRRRPASLASTMTSYLLDRLLGRGRPPGPGDCIFCDIAAHRKDAYIIAETAEYAAFLDVLPIRAGSSCDLKRACLLARTHTCRAQGTRPQDFRAKQADSRCYYGRRRLCCPRDGGWYVVSFSVSHSRAAFKSEGLQVAANQEYAQTIDHVRSSETWCRSPCRSTFTSSRHRLWAGTACSTSGTRHKTRPSSAAAASSPTKRAPRWRL